MKRRSPSINSTLLLLIPTALIMGLFGCATSGKDGDSSAGTGSEFSDAGATAGSDEAGAADVPKGSRVEASEVEQFTSLIRAMISGDRAAFRRTAERHAVLRSDAPFTDEEVYDWFSGYYELVLDDRLLTVTPEYAGGLLRKTFDAKANEILKYANVPPTFALIQRINMGVFSLLARLGARANWRRISEELWTWTDAAPSTPIGEAEARWLATKTTE